MRNEMTVESGPVRVAELSSLKIHLYINSDYLSGENLIIMSAGEKIGEFTSPEKTNGRHDTVNLIEIDTIRPIISTWQISNLICRIGFSTHKLIVDSETRLNLDYIIHRIDQNESNIIYHVALKNSSSRPKIQAELVERDHNYTVDIRDYEFHDEAKFEISLRSHTPTEVPAEVLVLFDNVAFDSYDIFPSSDAGTLQLLDKVIGQVDTAGPQFVTGWMRPENAHSDRKVILNIDGEDIAITVADVSRADVESEFLIVDAGFLIPIAARFKDGRRHSFTVRRASDGCVLPSTESAFQVGGAYLSYEIRSNGLMISATRNESGLLNDFPVKFDIYLDKQLHTTQRARWIKDQGGLRRAVSFLPKSFINSTVGRELNVTCPALSLQLSKPISTSSIVLGKMIGNLDGVDNSQAHGWASYSDSQTTSVTLEFYIDGMFVGEIAATRPRPDLASAGLTNTAHGFRLSLPSKLLHNGGSILTITDKLTGQRLLGTPYRLPVSKAIKTRRSIARPVAKMLSRRNKQIGHSSSTAGYAADRSIDISIIILTRLGAPVLRECIESILHNVMDTNYEIIIMNHGDDQETEMLIGRWQKQTRMLHIRVGGNNSFSYSNNFAAKNHAVGEYLLFLNNDVILISDAIAQMRAYLAQYNDVGLVGCKLIESRRPDKIDGSAIHHAGIMLTMRQDGKVMPIEAHEQLHLSDLHSEIEVFSVTGACSMMRRNEFLEIGGFNEAYFYGAEDVEIGESVRAKLQKRVVCLNNLSAIHYRGWFRLSEKGESMMPRVRANEDILVKKLGYQMMARYNEGLYHPSKLFSAERGSIGFVVLDASLEPRTGEYYTAYELAKAVSDIYNIECVFVDPDGGWYDVSGITCLINMLHEYNPFSLSERGSHITNIAWIRNNFELWENPGRLEQYDLILSSSLDYVHYLQESYGIESVHFPIATAIESMRDGSTIDQYESDVTFNGNFAGVSRESVQALNVLQNRYKISIYGHGWGQVPEAEQIWRGFLPYREMANLYKSVPIIVDDPNQSSRKWGGTNSRVFDAIAGGALPLTSSMRSSEVDFDGLLPVWTGVDELTELTHLYMNSESARREVREELQRIVQDRHTYHHRARSLHELLQARARPRRVAIMCPSPTKTTEQQWGDTYLCIKLASELRKLGYNVSVRFRDEWQSQDNSFDAVIVLRGLGRYIPRPHHINILWLISHPDEVSVAEMMQYDKVAFASESLMVRYGDIEDRSLVVRQFSTFSSAGARELSPDEQALLDRVDADDILFVGNTRSVRRNFVCDISEQLNVKFIGQGWDQYVPASSIISEGIANDILERFYARARFVLNEHWHDMKQGGIVSNRIADIVEAGSIPVSDHVTEGSKLFGEGIFFTDARSACTYIKSVREGIVSSSKIDALVANARTVIQKHMSPRRAAECLSTALTTAAERRMNGWGPFSV